MYLHYNGDIQHENNILANRRKELKLTQQQVAERAGIQLRAYAAEGNHLDRRN